MNQALPTSSNKMLAHILDLFKSAKKTVMNRWQFFVLLAAVPVGFYILKAYIGIFFYGKLVTWLAFIFAILQMLTAFVASAAIAAGLQDQGMTDWQKAYSSVIPRVKQSLAVGLAIVIIEVVAAAFIIIPAGALIKAAIFIAANLYVALGGKQLLSELKNIKAALMKKWTEPVLDLAALALAIWIIYGLMIRVIIALGFTSRTGVLLTAVFVVVAWPYSFAYVYEVYKELKGSRPVGQV